MEIRRARHARVPRAGVRYAWIVGPRTRTGCRLCLGRAMNNLESSERVSMSTSIRPSFRAIWLGVILIAGLPSFVLADEVSADAVKQLQQKLDQSIKMIEALAARVKEL